MAPGVVVDVVDVMPLPVGVRRLLRMVLPEQQAPVVVGEQTLLPAGSGLDVHPLADPPQVIAGVVFVPRHHAIRLSNLIEPAETIINFRRRRERLAGGPGGHLRTALHLARAEVAESHVALPLGATVRRPDGSRPAEGIIVEELGVEGHFAFRHSGLPAQRVVGDRPADPGAGRHLLLFQGRPSEGVERRPARAVIGAAQVVRYLHLGEDRGAGGVAVGDRGHRTLRWLHLGDPAPGIVAVIRLPARRVPAGARQARRAVDRLVEHEKRVGAHRVRRARLGTERPGVVDLVDRVRQAVGQGTDEARGGIGGHRLGVTAEVLLARHVAAGVPGEDLDQVVRGIACIADGMHPAAGQKTTRIETIGPVLELSVLQLPGKGIGAENPRARRRPGGKAAGAVGAPARVVSDRRRAQVAPRKVSVRGPGTVIAVAVEIRERLVRHRAAVVVVHRPG